MKNRKDLSRPKLQAWEILLTTNVGTETPNSPRMITMSKFKWLNQLKWQTSEGKQSLSLHIRALPLLSSINHFPMSVLLFRVTIHIITSNCMTYLPTIFGTQYRVHHFPTTQTSRQIMFPRHFVLQHLKFMLLPQSKNTFNQLNDD